MVGGGVTLASGRNIGWNVQKGRTWNGQPVEGLLLNSRMVQATFNDRNPDTVERWAYPDTKKWDADRNTAEFIEMMPTWRKHGLLAVTLNLQGGSPEGYSKVQPWHNSAINSDGTLDEKTMARLAWFSPCPPGSPPYPQFSPNPAVDGRWSPVRQTTSFIHGTRI